MSKIDKVLSYFFAILSGIMFLLSANMVIHADEYIDRYGVELADKVFVIGMLMGLFFLTVAFSAAAKGKAIFAVIISAILVMMAML